MGGCVRAVPVTFHHDAAANQDLAARRGAVVSGLRIEDLAFYSFQRLTNGADHKILGGLNESSTASFGEAVGLQHINPEGVEIVRDFRIEARSAGHEIPHSFPEQRMNFAEENSTRIE